MMINLKCSCGAAVDIDDGSAVDAGQVADKWLDRHEVCKVRPAQTSQPADPPASRTDGPWPMSPPLCWETVS